MSDEKRQRPRSNVIVPPAEIIETINTTGSDAIRVLDADGTRQWCLLISCPQAVIVDVEEGVDPNGTLFVRARNDDSVVFPLTIAAGVATIIRGVKYGRALRLKIKQSTTPGAAVVHFYAQ